MVTINGSYPPISPEGIKNFLEDNFKGKEKSLQLSEAVSELKREWVKAIIHNGQVENALSQYINLFYME